MPRGKLLNGLVTQQKVLRAAVALFLEKGYTRTTTGEIAKAAGIGQSSFFHVFPSKEALLLELVQRMFSGQFALAGQHSGEQDPVLLYAVETALQLHIAELTEPLRELYVMAYSLPSIAAYLYKSTTKRLQVIFGPYLPEAQPKDFYEMEIASHPRNSAISRQSSFPICNTMPGWEPVPMITAPASPSACIWIY